MLNSSLLAWISGPGKIKDPKSWLEINLDPNHQISLHFIKNRDNLVFGDYYDKE